MSTELEKKLRRINLDKQEKITPENIKVGVNILGVMGRVKEGVISRVQYDRCLALTKVISGIKNRYDELQYLESSAQQYINTGYRHTANTNVEIKFRQSSTNSSQYAALFGARKSGYYSNAFLFFTRFQYANFCYSRTGTETRGTAVYDKDITLNVNGKTATYTDGTNTYSITTTGTLDNAVNDLLLFNTNTGVDNTVVLDSTDTSGMRIYYCKIYEGETLVMDLVPCRDNLQKQLGMLDKLNDVFYPRLGDGEFLYEEKEVE